MSIKDSHSRKVSFNRREELGDKIDKLAVMIGKLPPEIGDQVDNLNHKFTKAKIEDKTEATMTDAIMISKVIRIDIDQTVETGDSIGKTEVDPGMYRNVGEGILEVTRECIISLKDKTVEESIEMKVMAEVEIGAGLEKGYFPQILGVIEQATGGPGQDQE